MCRMIGIDVWSFWRGFSTSSERISYFQISMMKPHILKNSRLKCHWPAFPAATDLPCEIGLSSTRVTLGISLLPSELEGLEHEVVTLPKLYYYYKDCWYIIYYFHHYTHRTYPPGGLWLGFGVLTTTIHRQWTRCKMWLSSSRDRRHQSFSSSLCNSTNTSKYKHSPKYERRSAMAFCSVSLLMTNSCALGCITRHINPAHVQRAARFTAL